MRPDWDARFAEPGYAYGSAPNDFVVSCADRIPAGPVLCLAEGQGRNAVWLAGQGHAVVAVDRSAVGTARARELARERGVRVDFVVHDLETYAVAEGAWSAIVITFAHLPPALRERVHRAAARGLRPGGVFILEAYAPGQPAFGTGGPREPELLMSVETLRRELEGLEFLVARETEREVVEGRYHTGRAAVVQVLARRPDDPR